MLNNKQVSQVIIEQLVNFKVKNIYGYAGDTILKFFSALKNSPLNLYTTKHEGTAGLMASAESKLTGDIAVCVAHSGPGTANIVNGIADAYSDKTPLLLITGQVPSYNIGTDYKQFIKQQQLTEGLTVYSSILTNPESVVDLFYKAMTTAIVEGGVSHIVIPMDMWDKKTSAQPRKYPTHLNSKTIPENKQVKEASNIINNCNQPVILYGRGAKNCKDELYVLSEKISAPLINTLPVAGLFNINNNNVVGGLGLAGHQITTDILDQSDLIIIVGANWWPMDYTPRQPKIIQIDTSKGNIGATHPVDIGLVGDIQETFNTLLPMVNKRNDSSWKNQIEEMKSNWMKTEMNSPVSDSNPLDPEAVVKIISENIKENELITLDSGDNVVWFGKYFMNNCQDILISGTWRTMGFSIPAALSAKINKPDNPVTAITGDGGITMVLAELLTARKYELPIRIIIMDNNCLAMEKNRLKAADLNIEGVDLTNPDFIKLAEACGLDTYYTESSSEFENILKITEEIDTPTLIDVATEVKMPPGTKL